MKLQNYQRLDKQNFDQKDQDLIDKLSFLMNNYLQSIYNALNGRLSSLDNEWCTVKDISIVVDSNGKPKNTVEIQIDKTGMRPLGVQVIKAINTTNSNTYPTGQPFISYTPGTQSITVNNVTGLQADQKYTLTVKILGQ